MFTSKTDLTCPDAGEGAYIQPCPTSGLGARFTGVPLRADTEVTGNGLADRWIRSDTTDANVFMYLEDVAPDGKVSVVTEGRLKASLRAETPAPWIMPKGVPWHRGYLEDAQPLEPGTAVRLRFDLLPTSYIFKAGHRIRITVTGTDHRERERTPATPPRISILADAQPRSQVSLPFVTRKAEP
jgi:putative CocE/NonD family hydrolase